MMDNGLQNSGTEAVIMLLIGIACAIAYAELGPLGVLVVGLVLMIL